MTAHRLVAVADHAVLVEFGGDEITDGTRAQVHALDVALARRPPSGLVEVVPAMTTLLVVFDPLVTDHDAITTAVLALTDASSAAGSDTLQSGTRHVIEVCYDDVHAPDLPTLAARCALDPEAVVAAHLGGTYTVGMYGFAPGYAYLYGTPPAIRQPRHSTPGPPVPAGSVIVAGEQCLIIPSALSTGWFAIGRTAASVFTADHDHPFLFDVGDTVAFRRIGAAELASRLADAEATR